jgi:biofilm PGA synthesis N-glycosyltransferase PgaC
MHTIALLMLVFVALYPVVTGAVWITGGLLFRLRDERNEGEMPAGGWPGVTVLIPAYNEELVIATCVRAALAVDYPELDVVVLDDGSTDATAAVAAEAGAGDSRLEVVNDAVNRGKAERLNLGFRRARHELVIVCDADTHLHPRAPKLLVSRLSRSPLIVAVAGSPHITNRHSVIAALQILEVASIIGLIRRTQAAVGRVGTVAGVLGVFRRDAVLAVGGYDGRMATEDIDLSWRLLLAGWHTSFAPNALIGMQVPSTLSSLWAQRRRWARGQGEVLHRQLGPVLRWRNRRMWPLLIESLWSLLWVLGLALTLVLATLDAITGRDLPLVGFGMAWRVAIAVIALIQLAVALAIDRPHNPRVTRFFLLGPIYPLGYWAISAAAALRAETVALVTGPRREGVVWNIEREAQPGTRG